MKNYSDEIFVKQLKVIKFPDYSNYTSVNGSYQQSNKVFNRLCNKVFIRSQFCCTNEP